MSLIEGWKLVRKDGSTYDGYRWPLPVAGVTDPVVVEAHDIDPDNKRACPSRPGDGLCVALAPAGASSGGIALSEGVGLSLTYDESDVLGREDTKLRVARVTVVDTFDPLAKVRSGEWKDLTRAKLTYAELIGADLSGAYLSGADLYRADLARASLAGASLAGASLTGAVLAGANLAGAVLYRAVLDRAVLYRAVLVGADLTGADLDRADLSGADFTGACGEPRSGMPDGWRLNAQGRWERGGR